MASRKNGIAMRNARQRRQGLVLLLALSMLALFSLLAVTYVVAASSSRAGSKAMVVRANQSNTTTRGMTGDVLKQMLRGTRDQKSAFYMHALFEDIYDRNPIKVKFGHKTQPAAFQDNWCKRLTPTTGNGIELIKISLDPREPTNNTWRLSAFENAYNSRVITVLEGPLAGNSFRILKYVGYVRGPGDSAPDPNSPSYPSYTRPDAFDYDFSVMVDLTQLQDVQLTGQWMNPSNNQIETLTGSVTDWINLPNGLGLRNLFFFYNNATGAYNGYGCVINGAAFNNTAIGLEEVSTDPTTGNPVPGVGNIDSRRILNAMIEPDQQPTTFIRRVPLAMLPNYDYLSDPTLMQTTNGVTGVPEIGDFPRTPSRPNVLLGSTNEGFDVADWHDFWLANQSYVGGILNSIPSFHRPELIGYIANLFGDPNSLTQDEIDRLLLMIDASTARVMSYGARNPNFGPSISFPKLGPKPYSVSDLQLYVRRLIEGPWDVDNDGDGIPDSVWINPSMPTMYSPEGKLLKPLASVLIMDLDNRINLNAHGDRSQGSNPLNGAFAPGFNSFTDNSLYLRGIPTGVNAMMLPQGFGYGPAEISMNRLFGMNANLLSTGVSSFSLFDERYGARNYTRRPINFNEVDRTPGQRAYGGFNGDDFAGRLHERETAYLDPVDPNPSASHGRLPGMPMGRRGNVAATFDRYGNMTMVYPGITDTYPDLGLNPAPNLTSETIGDAYEMRAMSQGNSDTPFTLAELERILRRFDEDSTALPGHLVERFRNAFGGTYNNASNINKMVTTLSGELRHPKLGAALVRANGSGGLVVDHDAGNFMGLIRFLHEQRYRKRTLPTPAGSDEPVLNMEALYELFPQEISSGLKFDINRAFGNGFDDDNDGQVDEPQELANSTENELKLFNNGVVYSTAQGVYRRELKVLNSSTRQYLGSRQLAARYLYSFAQLLIPRDYEFPGMNGVTKETLMWYKLRGRSIAQWAINVIDFRDADAAMTRFEYDILPFGHNNAALGTPRDAFWAPDRLTVYDSSSNTWSNNPAARAYVGVVWGMESPEMLLTESLAFHDKRVRDTDMDNGVGKTIADPTNPDPNFDQYRFPEGSLFLELMSTRTTAAPANDLLPGVPPSLYVADSGTIKLNLAARAPADNAGPGNTTYWGSQPVWRIGINASTPPGSANAAQQPNAIYQGGTGNIYQRDFQVGRANQINGDATANSPELYVGTGLVTDLSTMTGTNTEFDRFVWFIGDPANTLPRVPNLIGNDPTTELNSNKQHKVFYNTNIASPYLAGGSYLVVGPRTQTTVGALTTNPITESAWDPILRRIDMGTSTLRPIRSPSHQFITLGNGTVLTGTLNGKSVVDYYPEWSNAMKSPMGMVCTCIPPIENPLPSAGQRWGDCFPNGVGLNISMPDPVAGKGYWTPSKKPYIRLNTNDLQSARSDQRLGWGDTSIAPDSWVDVFSIGSSKFPDEPFDYNPTTNPILASAASPMNQTGTYPNVRSAFLQRLADPERPFDPIVNPYITVDWISIDLTVFNGESPSGTDPDDMGGATIAFQSRYKDGADQSSANNKSAVDTGGIQPVSPGAKSLGGVNSWGYTYHSVSTARLRKTKVQTLVAPLPTPAAQSDKRFSSYFMHQLGYVAQQPADPSGAVTKYHNSATTLGYANVGYHFGTLVGSTADVAQQFDGFGPLVDNANNNYDGATPDLTSVAWFNRPFATPYEIMMVPFASPGQFGLFHGPGKDGDIRHAFSPGDFTDPTKRAGYLPNFQTMNPWSNLGGGPNWATKSNTTNVEADWPLLFEFIETQPPFIDASKSLNAEDVLAAAAATPLAARFLNSYLPPNYTGNNEPEMMRGPSFLAPFHSVPTYVSAGKINLNTVTQYIDGSCAALQAIENNYLVGNQRTSADDALKDSFIATRRGYPLNQSSGFFGAAVGLNVHPNYPTQFAGVFNSGLSSNIAPVAPAVVNQQRTKFGVESTLVRSFNPNLSGATLPTGANTGNLMFSPDSQLLKEVPPMSVGFAGSAAPQEADDGNRNAFTRYQRVMRLPNLVTDQSNVFSIWVTVSLFEYDPVTGFGREYVDSAGETKRERSFYIVDRTVPVGFIPGEDLNTEKAVLLKRKISGE